MRLSRIDLLKSLVAVLAILATAPAQAQQSPIEQYHEAKTAFLGQDYAATLASEIVSTLAGRWGSMPIRESGFEASCSSQGYDVALTGSGFAMSSNGPGSPVTVTYTSRGGNVFDSYADPKALLDSYSLGDNPGSPIAMALLSGTNGISTVHRPSPDIMVIQTNYGIPQIYTRCGE